MFQLLICLFVLLLYVPSQQLWPWWDSQFTSPYFFLGKLEQAVYMISFKPIFSNNNGIINVLPGGILPALNSYKNINRINSSHVCVIVWQTYTLYFIVYRTD